MRIEAAVTLAVGLSSACGGDTGTPTDSGSPDAAIDSTIESGAPDASIDAFGDVSVDGADGSTKPAIWSRGYSPASYGNGALDSKFGIALDVLAAGAVDYGLGTLQSNSMGLVAFATDGGPKNGAWDASVVFPVRTSLADFGMIGGGGGALVSEIKTTGPETQAYFNTPNWFGEILSGGKGRVRAAAYSTVAVQVADSGTALINPPSTYLSPGGFAMATYNVPSWGQPPVNYRILPAPTSTLTVAVDAVLLPDASSLYVAGRLARPQFDFGGGLYVGSGLFLAKYNMSDLSLAWVKVFGGTPLQPVSVGANDIVGVGCHLAWDGSAILFSAPYTGQINFGDGAHTAPSNSHAVAFGRIDPTNGTPLASASFAKGPSAAGNPTRPTIRAIAGGNFAVFDTVWDTVDVGGVTVQASSSADVYLATFDAAGKGLSSHVWSAAGDDLAVWMDVDPSGDYFIVGHSDSSIDFGNGLLPASGAGQVWIARVSP